MKDCPYTVKKPVTETINKMVTESRLQTGYGNRDEGVPLYCLPQSR